MPLIDDLNFLIRYFSNHIADAIQNMDKNMSDSSVNGEDSSELLEIVDRYKQYKIESGVEAEMVKKMGMRLLQIFGFFKNKSRHQLTLSHIDRQLKNRINILIGQNVIELNKIVKFVVFMSHRKFTPNYRHHLSISDPIPRVQIRSRRRVWSRMGTKQTTKSQNSHPFKGKSVTSCKLEIKKSKNQSADTILELYKGMSIERNSIIKCLQNRQETEKQQLKRNHSAAKKTKEHSLCRQKVLSMRKMKTENNFEDYGKILGEISASNKIMYESEMYGMKKSLVPHWKNKRKKLMTGMKRANIQSEQEKERRVLKNKENSYLL